MTPLIYHLTFRGFYSEINNLILGYLFALDQGHPFKLYSKDWISAYDRGWQDYFVPFCEETDDEHLAHPTILPHDPFTHWRLNLVYHRLKILKKKILRQPFFAQDLYYDFRETSFLSKNFNLPQYDLTGDIFSVSRGLMKQILTFNPATKQYLDEGLKLAKLPKQYIAMHIRRGDKVSGKKWEANRIDIRDYFEMAIKARPALKDVFIATDDFAVIRESRLLYPEFTIHTLCSEEKAGHDEATFAQMTPMLRKKETLAFLLESEIMKMADIFIGTYSSNVGKAMALLRDQNTYSVDLQWSPG
ncbi:MAG: hypothetical protein RIC30_06160 [Marinoscillum sp.]|uniref:hypothetical protein n=1 Tax=Marinoscillum sp. TaxID=2024838 RepID=UPI0032F1482D